MKVSNSVIPLPKCAEEPFLSGAKDCTPEINTSEILVDVQWHFQMGFVVSDFWCDILP